MEEHIIQKQVNAIKEYDEEIEWREDRRDDEDPFDYFISDPYRFGQKFPNILRSSLLIGVYSFLENTLTEICKDIQRKKKYSVKFKSINGKGIDKVKTYLSEVAQVDFPSNTKEWQDINDYRVIRNCFAHSEGSIVENDKRVIKSVERLDLIAIDGNVIFGKYIKLEQGFIDNFIETVRGFLRMIESQYLNILYPFLYIRGENL